MNYNILAYGIYFTLTAIVTVRVGWLCYKYGEPFVYMALNNKELTAFVNKMLLIGYYLMNLGYCAITIMGWQKIESVQELVPIVAAHIGLIIMLLAGMHFLNIIVLYFISKKNYKPNTQHHE